MKKGVLIIVCAIGACMICFSSAGCSDKKPAVVADSDSVQTDSLEAITDTLDQIIAEAPMKKAADELFEDYFINCATNRKLQQKQIEIP